MVSAGAGVCVWYNCCVMRLMFCIPTPPALPYPTQPHTSPTGNEDLQVEAMTEIMHTRIREEMSRVRARAAPESAEERRALAQRAFALSLNASKYARQVCMSGDGI